MFPVFRHIQTDLAIVEPSAYLNYFLFDKNHNMLDLGYKLVDPTTWQKNRNFISDIKIKEAGYIFVFLSYDNTQSTNFVYFDDLNITLTKSNVIQYNDYYPFDRKHPQAGHATTTATVFSAMPATS